MKCHEIWNEIRAQAILDSSSGRDFFILKHGKTNNKLFCCWLEYFGEQATKKKNKELKNNTIPHVGIDLEFFRNNIALIQLCAGAVIWLIEPKNLDNTTKQLLITNIFVHKNIYKIMHGSESLDLPYLFQDWLKSKKNIIRFISKWIDTRFLCDYVRIAKQNPGKCGFYEALLYFDVITPKKKQELDLLVIKMGPIQHIRWNLQDMSDNQVKYAYYDVMYLQDLLYKIYAQIPREQAKLFRDIKTILRFVILERLHITSFSKNIPKTGPQEYSKELKLVLSYGYVKNTLIDLLNSILANRDRRDNLTRELINLNLDKLAEFFQTTH